MAQLLAAVAACLAGCDVVAGSKRILCCVPAGALRPEGLLSPRLAVPHPVTAAKAAYLSFKLSGFLAQSQAAHAATSPAPAAAAATSSSNCTASSTLQPAAASSSSSPWRVGLWTPWAHEGLSNPGLQGKLSSHGLPAAGVQKYPAYVEVTLSAIPRPNGAVVVTDPAAGIRTALPAGYGSGFEIGEWLLFLWLQHAVHSRQPAGLQVSLSGLFLELFLFCAHSSNAYSCCMAHARWRAHLGSPAAIALGNSNGFVLRGPQCRSWHAGLLVVCCYRSHACKPAVHAEGYARRAGLCWGRQVVRRQSQW